jgi:hypothetical protein
MPHLLAMAEKAIATLHKPASPASHQPHHDTSEMSQEEQPTRMNQFVRQQNHLVPEKLQERESQDYEELNCSTSEDPSSLVARVCQSIWPRVTSQAFLIFNNIFY